jgi:hypothetical protein
MTMPGNHFLGEAVTIISDHPDLPCGSQATVIATDDHPSVPVGYLLVLDEHYQAHLTSWVRNSIGQIWKSLMGGSNGPTVIPDDILVPGDIVVLKDGTLATVVSILAMGPGNASRTKVTVPRRGQVIVLTSDLTRYGTAGKKETPRTRFDIIDDVGV